MSNVQQIALMTQVLRLESCSWEDTTENGRRQWGGGCDANGARLIPCAVQVKEGRLTISDAVRRARDYESGLDVDMGVPEQADGAAGDPPVPSEGARVR